MRPLLLTPFWSPVSCAPWVSIGAVVSVLGFIFFAIGGSGLVGICAPPLTSGGQIASISADGRTVVLVPDVAGPAKTFSSDKLGKALTGLGPGDSVCFSVSGDSQQALQLDAIAVKQVTVGRSRAMGALLLAFAAVWWIMLAITRGHPWGFTNGLDGRLSNSQTQIYLWFLVLSTVYLSESGLRLLYAGVIGGITVPTNLLALAGVSAFTFGTARLNTMAKTNGAAPAMLSGVKDSETRQLSRREMFRQLFTNDNGLPDLGDMQMVILSAIACIVYLGVSATFLVRVSLSGHIDLPPVDDTLLGGTAVSQGAYLFKKLASRPGN